MVRKTMTLCMVHKHPQILLGLKKRGFGKGRWNGFGGKVEKGESIEEAAKREMHEEIGVTPTHMEEAGFIEFNFPETEEILDVHIFRVKEFVGEPRESDEMEPRWFHFDEIPFSEMWKDDMFWYPFFLQEKKFKGKVSFTKDHEIIDYLFEEEE